MMAPSGGSDGDRPGSSASQPDEPWTWDTLGPDEAVGGDDTFRQMVLCLVEPSGKASTIRVNSEPGLTAVDPHVLDCLITTRMYARIAAHQG